MATLGRKKEIAWQVMSRRIALSIGAGLCAPFVLAYIFAHRSTKKRVSPIVRSLHDKWAAERDMWR